MSIRIKIGNVEHDLAQADEHWVISQIRDQQHDKGSVCIQITIQGDGVDLHLRSAGCSATYGGAGRPATSKELKILELWEQHGRRKMTLGGGEIVAFLKQLQRIV